MSEATESGAVAAPVRRPGTVTAAAAVLTGMAVASVAYAAYHVASVGGMVNRFRDAAARTDATRSDVEAVVAAVRVGTLVAVGVGVAVAVLLIVLAVGIARGSNAARIAAWIVSGLGLVCGCLSLGTLLLQRAVPVSATQTGPVATDLIEALVAAYPTGWIGLSGGLSAGQALGYLVVAALLSLPSANSYFRRRQPAQRRPQTPLHAPPSPL